MFNNYDIFVGGKDDNALSDILQYNKESHTWQKVGDMKERRSYHAVAVLSNVSHLCP